MKLSALSSPPIAQEEAEGEVEEIPTTDGLEWLEARATRHVFRPLSPSGNSYAKTHHNNNLSLTIKKPVKLRFVHEGVSAPKVLQLDAGVQVLVYRPYKKAARGESVATFFVSDTCQITLLGGGALRVRTREY